MPVQPIRHRRTENGSGLALWHAGALSRELFCFERAAFRGQSGNMKPPAVKVPVVAAVSVDCIFWPDADGWTGACAEFSLSVNGVDFEQSKKNMEAALETCISRLVQEKKMAA